MSQLVVDVTHVTSESKRFQLWLVIENDLVSKCSSSWSDELVLPWSTSETLMVWRFRIWSCDLLWLFYTPLKIHSLKKTSKFIHLTCKTDKMGNDLSSSHVCMSWSIKLLTYGSHTKIQSIILINNNTSAATWETNKPSSIPILFNYDTHSGDDHKLRAQYGDSIHSSSSSSSSLSYCGSKLLPDLSDHSTHSNIYLHPIP